MFVIPPHEAGVTLHTLGGTAKFFSSRQLLFNHLGWRVIRQFLGTVLDASAGVYFVVNDGEGAPLTAADFKPYAMRLPPSYGPNSLVARHVRAEALREKRQPGPVPGTGRRRGGNAYRRPGTRAERRENIFVDLDVGEPRLRGARSWKNLASSWDDLVRSDYGLRSWKHFRAHQWKN